MAATLRKILIIGGGGTLGPSITKALLTAGTFEVTVLSREGSKSTFSTEIKKLTSDFTPKSLVESFKGQDAVIDIVAQSPVDDRKKFIDAAIEAGVKRFIPSEFSGNMENKTNVSLIPMFSERIAIRDYLKEKAATNPTFSYTTVSTGPFYDWALKNGFIGFNLTANTATIYGDGNQPFSVTTLSSVGTAVAGILSKPAETANKGIFVASFTPTQNTILALLGEITGKTWKIEKQISIGDALSEGFEALGRGDVYAGIVSVLMASTYGPGNGNDFPKDARLSNELLGLPKEDLKSVTKAIVEGKDV